MDSGAWRLSPLLGALALAWPGGSDAWSSTPAGSLAPGYLDVGVSARTFDAPLFGNDSLATYHLFGNQRFPGTGTFSLWLGGGFPGYTPQYGLEGDEIPLAGRVARVNAGDFGLSPLLPDALYAAADSYPLVGGRLRIRDGRSTWNVFAGTAKYDLELPGGPKSRPGLYGGEILGRWGADSYGAGVTLVEQPSWGDPEKVRDRDVVLSGRYAHEFSPWAQLFGEALSAGGRDLGFRAGVHWRFQTGSLSTSLYSFDEGFPYVYPLYRPGERGVDLRGRYEPSELTDLYGNVYYASDSAVLHRSELRGSLGFALNLGSNRPSLSFDFSHEDIAYDSLVAPESGLVVDRYAVSVGRNSSSDLLSARLEHVSSANDAGLDRTQALLTYRTILGSTSLLEGSAVVQRDASGDFGLTAESAVERPLRNRLDYLVGLGGAYVDRGNARSGEGVARLGLALRLRGSGWYARTELRFPFSIGLERSHLNRRILSLDVGSRFDWKQARWPIGSSSSADARPLTGIVEGNVLKDGSAQAGVAVMLEGDLLGVTRSDGSFRIRRVPAGKRFVTLDTRALPPRYAAVGGFSREVEILPEQVTRVDFVIARVIAFQGALMACGDEKMAPVGGARLTLSNGATIQTTYTSNVGGFRFGEVPPGVYELAIDPASVGPGIPAERLPRTRLDLADDVLGYLVRIGCPGRAEGSAAR